MNKKVLTAIVCVAVVIIAAGVAIALTQNGGGNTTTKATVSETQSIKDDSTTQNKSETTESTTETTTETTTTKASYPFLKENVWYLYDNDKRIAYGFKFTNDDDDLVVAYFDEDNINGEDAKYSKSKCDYEIKNDKIIITDLPDNYGVEKFTLTVSGDSLKDEKGTTLDKQDDLKLEYPFDHFNAE